jgi:hypothetical protein
VKWFCLAIWALVSLGIGCFTAYRSKSVANGNAIEEAGAAAFFWPLLIFVIPMKILALPFVLIGALFEMFYEMGRVHRSRVDEPN